MRVLAIQTIDVSHTPHLPTSISAFQDPSYACSQQLDARVLLDRPIALVIFVLYSLN